MWIATNDPSGRPGHRDPRRPGRAAPGDGPPTDDRPTDDRRGRRDMLVVMATPTEVVEAFCRAWEAVDIDALALFFADDAVYHNMPMDPIVGRDTIAQVIRSFTAGAERVEFEIVNISADGPIVLTERIDRFVLPDRTVTLPVMGAFEVHDGHITAWRDYFDLNQYLRQVS
jgi:limonene-1,2-epoxide hydrolase